MLAICIVLAAAVCGMAALCIWVYGVANRKSHDNAEEITRLRAANAAAETLLAETKENAERRISESKDVANLLIEEAKTAAQQQTEELKAAYERQIAELKQNHENRIKDEREALGERFKAIAAEILHANSKQLDEHSKLSLSGIIEPMKVSIEQFTKGFRECYDVENRDRLSLREEIKSLHDLNMRVGTEAARLAGALKGNTRVQGEWGEMVLANILEHSGLQQGRWFVTQESTTADDGARLRPDAVIHCPKDRDIIIDSKASLTSYLSMLEAEDEDTRKEFRDAHVKSVENHIAILRKKEYQEKIGAKKGDFVLMFMPHEGAYLAAMHAKPDLWQKAYDSHVIMVSPTHLVTVVRLVEQMWQTEDQTVNSEKIAEEASKLLESLNSFLADMSAVGDSIDKVKKTFDSAAHRLSTGNNNVVRVARRLEALGVKAKKSIPDRFVE